MKDKGQIPQEDGDLPRGTKAHGRLYEITSKKSESEPTKAGDSQEDFENRAKKIAEEARFSVIKAEEEIANAIKFEAEILPKIVRIKEQIAELAKKYVAPSLEQGGKSILVVASDPTQASTKENFVEILFYPKGQSLETRGVHTAILKFIFDPLERKIRVRMRPTVSSSALVEREAPIVLNDQAIKSLTNTTLDFAEEFAKKI